LTLSEIRAAIESVLHDENSLRDLFARLSALPLDPEDPQVRMVYQKLRAAIARASGIQAQPFRQQELTGNQPPPRAVRPPRMPSVQVGGDPGPVQPILTRYGLTAPDGRPLFAYRVTDAEFVAVRDSLSRINLRLLQGQKVPSWVAPAFVLFVAERYRREQKSLFREWEPLLRPVGLHSLSVANRSLLVDRGMRFFRRHLEERSGSRQYLLTIAIEAGFPLLVLTAPKESWLRDYVREVLKDSYGIPELDITTARKIAAEHRHLLRSTFQSDEFLEATALLAKAMANVRQQVPIAELQPISWLQTNFSNWRDTLPLSLDDDTAKKLIDGLVLLEPRRPTSGVGVRRLILLDTQGNGTPAVELGLEGSVDAARTFGLDARAGRCTLSPIGALGDRLAGPIGVIDPPAEGEGMWRVRPLIAARLVRDVGLNRRIETLGRNGLRAVELTWPGGEPLTGEFFVLEPLAECPTWLAVVGTGSIARRSPVLYVIVPESWRLSVTVPDGAPPERTGTLIGSNLVIWRVSASTVIQDDQALEGNRFRVEPSADPWSREVRFGGESWSGFRPEDRAWHVRVGSTTVDLRGGHCCCRGSSLWRTWLAALVGATATRGVAGAMQRHKRRVHLCDRSGSGTIGKD
jgi:hypothetical protein